MDILVESYNGKNTDFIEIYKDKSKIALRALSYNKFFNEKDFKEYAKYMARRLKNRYEEKYKDIKVTNIDFTNIEDKYSTNEFDVTIKYI